VIVVVIAAAIGLYVLHRNIQLLVNGCEARGSGNPVMLSTEQAAIAATIAGVAHERQLPSRAVTIAYATAWQESHLRNLDYGTLDSVGVFQQRPSEGWGTRKELTDPVYATGKFFAALVKVPGYRKLPVYQAAQDVQRSADGNAYQNYEGEAAIMSGPFTGGSPHGVWCWYPQSPSPSQSPSQSQSQSGRAGARVSALRAELVRTFGQLDLRDGATSAAVRVRHPAAGWAVASWLVTHATAYGLTSVRYAGYQWNLTAGSHGWTRDPSAPRGRVELR
jgi:hypothetical protein